MKFTTESLEAVEAEAEEVLCITVTTVVDNEVAMKGLGSVWGLSFYIEIEYPSRSEAILFDTGGSSQVFRHNAKKLGLNLAAVQALAFSHFHHDHFGAFETALKMINRSNCVVYIPAPHKAIEETLAKMGVRSIVANDSQAVIYGVRTSGALGPIKLREQGLVINAPEKGLVVITGCAHPGAFNLVKKAKQVFPNRPVFALIGGFHIKTKEDGQKLGKALKKLGLGLVSPCHCTSKDAKQGILEIVGKEVYQQNGSGTKITIQ
ncbi:MAG: MBL fold metallo-hydrolase [Promethearchaeota archaeon]